jgi:hypothetical protein
MAAVNMPGLAKGKATWTNASKGLALKVAATSMGRLPMASNACCKGCTENGKEYKTDPMSSPVKVNEKTPQPKAWVICPKGPCGPMTMRR